MHYTTVLTALAASFLFDPCLAAYQLQDDYSVDFFDQFDFSVGGDPTHGFVNFVDQATAQQSGLISNSSNGIYIGVDNKNIASSGRNSVRITSKKSYDNGLVILDLAHMPGSVCGTWPAFWMVGSNWPNNGEIDIIEGVNDATSNSMTLHTKPGCTISDTGAFSGQVYTANCDVNAPGQSANSGCSIGADIATSYGDGFNSASGGVYATEWTDDHISIWYFPRAKVPADITNGTPNPSGWGTPAALFQGSCNIPQTFNDLSIVFDITFCGDWAGNVWNSGSCAAKASTCSGFVANNPKAFQQTFWQINSLKTYQNAGNSRRSSSSAATSSNSKVKSRTAVTPHATALFGNVTAPVPTSAKRTYSQSADLNKAPTTATFALSAQEPSKESSTPSTVTESAPDCDNSADTVTDAPADAASTGIVQDVLEFTTAWPDLKKRACKASSQSETLAPSAAVSAEPGITGSSEASSVAQPATTLPPASTATGPPADNETALAFTAAFRRDVQERSAYQVARRDTASVRRAQHLHRHKARHGSGLL